MSSSDRPVKKLKSTEEDEKPVAQQASNLNSTQQMLGALTSSNINEPQITSISNSMANAPDEEINIDEIKESLPDNLKWVLDVAGPAYKNYTETLVDEVIDEKKDESNIALDPNTNTQINLTTGKTKQKPLH
jgi:hypothetical protein